MLNRLGVVLDRFIELQPQIASRPGAPGVTDLVIAPTLIDAAALLQLARSFDLLQETAMPLAELTESVSAGQAPQRLRAPALRLKN